MPLDAPAQHVAILYTDGSMTVLSLRKSRHKLLTEARHQCKDDNFNVRRDADLARVVEVEITVKREIPDDEQ